jgi:hypothetical protein
MKLLKLILPSRLKERSYTVEQGTVASGNRKNRSISRDLSHRSTLSMSSSNFNINGRTLAVAEGHPVLGFRCQVK